MCSTLQAHFLFSNVYFFSCVNYTCLLIHSNIHSANIFSSQNGFIFNYIFHILHSFIWTFSFIDNDYDDDDDDIYGENWKYFTALIFEMNNLKRELLRMILWTFFSNEIKVREISKLTSASKNTCHSQYENCT